MKTHDPRSITEWLYLEPDGELTAAELRQLESAAATSPEIARAREELSRLDKLLEESRIEVQPGFKADVLASLPPAPWSARSPRGWWGAAATLTILGGLAALLAGLSAAQLEPASPFLAAMAAVGDLLASSLVAGAGLIGASWHGLGLAIGDWIGASTPNAIAFGVIVVGLNVIVVRRLRRRARTLATARASRSRSKSTPVE